mgnify:CR=1 FL=1|jgi:hypothetical protein
MSVYRPQRLCADCGKISVPRQSPRLIITKLARCLYVPFEELCAKLPLRAVFVDCVGSWGEPVTWSFTQFHTLVKSSDNLLTHAHAASVRLGNSQMPQVGRFD